MKIIKQTKRRKLNLISIVRAQRVKIRVQRQKAIAIQEAVIWSKPPYVIPVDNKGTRVAIA